MIVFVDDRRPTGLGESLSGKKAFYINVTQCDDWHSVEIHPEFTRLPPQEQDEVKLQFTRSVQLHKIIKTTRFY